MVGEGDTSPADADRSDTSPAIVLEETPEPDRRNRVRSRCPGCWSSRARVRPLRGFSRSAQGREALPLARLRLGPGRSRDL